MDKEKLRLWISDIMSMNLRNEPFHGTHINWTRSEDRLLDDLVEFVERVLKGDREDEREQRGRSRAGGRPKRVVSASLPTKMWARSKYQGAWDPSHTERPLGGTGYHHDAGGSEGLVSKKNRKAGEGSR